MGICLRIKRIPQKAISSDPNMVHRRVPEPPVLGRAAPGTFSTVYSLDVSALLSKYGAQMYRRCSIVRINHYIVRSFLTDITIGNKCLLQFISPRFQIIKNENSVCVCCCFRLLDSTGDGISIFINLGQGEFCSGIALSVPSTTL